jgi:hypothetical protein
MATKKQQAYRIFQICRIYKTKKNITGANAAKIPNTLTTIEKKD